MQYRRSRAAGGTFFFTVVTARRRPLFADESNVAVLRAAIREVRERHPFGIDAFVVLPDHLHCMWTLLDGDNDFSTRWRMIKGTFSRRCREMPTVISASRKAKGERDIWQRRFWEHEIKDSDDYRHHCDYIHYNPVKHGLCAAPRDWSLGTFSWLVERGLYPPDWGAQNAPVFPAGCGKE